MHILLIGITMHCIKIVKKQLKLNACVAKCNFMVWYANTRNVSIFDPHLLIVKSAFDCRLSGVYTHLHDML